MRTIYPLTVGLEVTDEAGAPLWQPLQEEPEYRSAMAEIAALPLPYASLRMASLLLQRCVRVRAAPRPARRRA